MNVDIPYVKKIVPDAYHGTSSENAHKILKSGKFKISNDAGDWLGSGVYFFESSLLFAKKHGRQNSADKQCAVICATIDLGKCLNLNDLEHAKAVQAAKKELKKRGVAEVTDALAINAVAHIAGAEVVRACFTWGSYGEISKRIPLANPLFICVRVQKNILDMHLCYEGE